MAIIELSTVAGAIRQSWASNGLSGTRPSVSEAVIAALAQGSASNPDRSTTRLRWLSTPTRSSNMASGKPPPVLDFFRHDFIRDAFFDESFEAARPD